MESGDLTIRILEEIRDELRELRSDTNKRFDETNGRIDETNRRIVESEVRTATAITALAGTVNDLATHLRATTELRPRVENCEREIETLKRRVARRPSSG
ncbi:MAG: hypothetical protein HY791_12425 [Deltaproteobacteria bacterium]|nr:hypothetical protein [Deltaproteobacteria bacterium]